MFSIIQAAGWPIWPLIFCSVIALAIVAERFYSLKRAAIVPQGLLKEAKTASSKYIPPADVIDKLEQNSALGELLAAGLRALQANPQASEEDLRHAIQNRGRLVANRLNKFLQPLATIATAAPLLGLLGTVVGMIAIFASQGSIDVGVVTGDPGQLAHGISVALYNTAFGLIVAIPALIFWRYFRSRVDSYILELEVASEDFVKHLRGLQP
ncbi:MotA/TolQ/ExbB proton channel family protein [Allofranklinella schreckenbergeri]|uniref:MotA/TolQ/ExbB proton channel family protein n=1 Tax=Allofranklinella schreckenbergeri TaxID=1076744 RepID=A0A3M6QCQ6_9BURK|nr:MotA/TolQ/ExbB proton channel family protein [Allofranklinella schreckenbergeri]RMX00497.1 MotA/TolQ/ExbB proton channel family protein [Allofranklinella schreckenbergeri]RMX00787.1 MotA/TolQ/ExbB proton channel family protein [Allofranklinella schreckenbergeri]RRD38732.1 MotA/TolQ/ExbB proton channel family protein [Comamonadaceae bacterium OH3737_COT-264]